MKRTLTAIALIAAVAAFVSIPVHAGEVINDEVVVDTGGSIDFKGGALKISGTEVTATAAEINAGVDGLTATATEINTVADGATVSAAELNALDDLAPTSIVVGNDSTNATAMPIIGDNITASQDGTNLTLTLSGNIAEARLTNAAPDIADEVAAAIAEGELADSVVVSADIKDNTIVASDVANGVFGTAADIYIDYGTCTNGETVVFTTAFGAAPAVCLTYAEDAGADTVCEAVSITTTNFVVQGAAAKNISYIAIGTIP